MTTTRRMCAGLAVLMFAATAAPAFAADDPILARFVGEWIGRGTYKSSATADGERLYCKITNKLVDNGKTLEQRGRCANPSQSTSIKGRIGAVGGGRYEGTLQSLTSEGPAKLTGSGSGGKIELTSEFTDRLTHKPATSAVTLVATAEGYRLITKNTTKGKTPFVGSDVNFTKE